MTTDATCKAKSPGRWVVVAASSVLLALSLGMYGSTNSVFVKPVCESLGLDRGPYTFYRTVLLLVGSVSLPFYSKLIAKWGIRNVFLFGTIGLVPVTLGFSFCQTLWQIYLCAALHGLVYNGINFMSVGVLINQYFGEKQGVALGIAYAGSGLGGAVMVPVVTWFVEMSGWRWAYRYIGIVGLVIMLPIVLMFIYDRPDKSISKEESIQQETSAKPDRQTTDLWKRKEVWYLSIAIFVIGLISSSVNTHLTPYFTDLGYSDNTAAMFVSVMMLSMMFGKIVAGLMYDQLGVTAGNVIVILSGFIGSVAALISRYPAAAWAFVIVIGFFSCAISVPVSIWTNRYFLKEEFTDAFSLLSMMGMMGTAVAAPVLGFIYDISRSYYPAWILFILLCVILSCCLLAVEFRYQRKS